MRIAVTGGAGFVGRTVVPELADKHDILISDIERPTESLIDEHQLTYRDLDVLDADSCQNVLSDVDAVFHKVGLKGGVNSLERPRRYYEVNVRGTLNVIEACRENGIENLCFDSTESVFGTTDDGAPFVEEDWPHPSSMYGGSKRIAEAYLSVIDEVNATVLRYPRIISSTNTNAVTRFHEMIDNGDSIAVYGDGTQSFDVVHERDVVEAHRCVIEAGFPDDLYHIATVDSIRVLDLIETVGDYLDKDPEYACVDRASINEEFIEDDLLPSHNSLDAEKSRESLGMDYAFPKVEDVLNSVLRQLSDDED